MTQRRLEAVSLQHETHGRFLGGVVFSRPEGGHFQMHCDLPVSGERLTAEAADVFTGFQELRRQMEPRGWRACCLGARRNVWPSVTNLNEGGGFWAYALLPEGSAAAKVRVFGPDDHPDGSTVAEQEAFAKAWFASRR